VRDSVSCLLIIAVIIYVYVLLWFEVVELKIHSCPIVITDFFACTMVVIIIIIITHAFIMRTCTFSSDTESEALAVTRWAAW